MSPSYRSTRTFDFSEKKQPRIVTKIRTVFSNGVSEGPLEHPVYPPWQKFARMYWHIETFSFWVRELGVGGSHISNWKFPRLPSQLDLHSTIFDSGVRVTLILYTNRFIFITRYKGKLYSLIHSFIHSFISIFPSW